MENKIVHIAGLTNSVGFGDVLRGIISLYKISKKLNAELIVDFSKHTADSVIKYKNEKYLDLIRDMDEIKYFDHDSFNNMYNYVDSQLRENNIVFLDTNAIFDFNMVFHNRVTSHESDIKHGEKEFMKNLLIPNEKMSLLIDKTLNDLPKDFNIIHFRISDSCFYNNDTDNLTVDINHIESKFLKYYEPNDVLITNDLNLKKYLVAKYNCMTLNVNIAHLGKESDKEKTFDTFLEFYVQTHSKKIKTYSEYSWLSGFCLWASKIYDIELIDMRN